MRKRSPHPGIVVLKARPEKRQALSIRYVDPDSGKPRTEVVPDVEDVKAWLKDQSLKLQQRQKELRDGAPKLANSSITKLVDSYFLESTVRASTAAQYRLSTNRMLSWPGCPASGDDLTLARLRELRAWLLKLPGRRTTTANRDLRQLAAVLEYSRKAGRTPRLSQQDIGDGLERAKATIERKPFCHDAPAVLVAAIAHDLDFGAYVAVLLLTGMRAGEALSVTASSFDERTSVIRLQAKDVKTAAWRDVELQWSPCGYMLMEALVLGKKPEQKLFGDRTSSYMREQRRQILENKTPSEGSPGLCRASTSSEGVVPSVPRFDFQMLRRTASTYLCSMSNVGLWRAAKSLGHHPDVARRHYAGVVRTDATELERALGVRNLVLELVATLRERRGASLPPAALVYNFRRTEPAEGSPGDTPATPTADPG